MKKKTKVILGGGAAYGLAHIGALTAISEQYEITGIIGTSMGAIVGALYACGYRVDEILDIAKELKTSELFSPLNLDLTMRGLFDGKGVLKRFEKLTNKRDIESGQIPIIAVAYDLSRRCSILIDKGSFANAMRASSSLPYVFAPFRYHQYYFVDGGVEHPLPVAFQNQLSGDFTIAVNVLPPVSMRVEAIDLSSPVTTAKERWKSPQVFLQSIMLNQGFIAVQSILHNRPQIVIDAYKPNSSPLDFSKGTTFYDWGYKQAQSALMSHKKPGFIDRLLVSYEELLSTIQTKFR